MTELVVIAHNIRSTYNVGSIFRSADGFGVTKLYVTGYTPYPQAAVDDRPPHIRNKLTAQIAKTALGAEQTVPFEYSNDPTTVINHLRKQGYAIAALEQAPQSTLLPAYQPPAKLALILGEEVHGVPVELLKQCDVTLEIPMAGRKESFNVSVAAGIALYALVTAK